MMLNIVLLHLEYLKPVVN